MTLIFLIAMFLLGFFIYLSFGKRLAEIQIVDSEQRGVEMFRPAFGLLLPFNRILGGKNVKEWYKAKLITGGNFWKLSFTDFIASMEILFILGFLVGYILMGSIFVGIVLAVLGAIAPYAYLADKVKGRQKKILRELPDFIDILTLSVEAGMTFSSALNEIFIQMPKSPIIMEFKQAIQEIQLGKSRESAFKAIARRNKLKQFTSFISSVVQAEKLGTSIGEILRMQSDILRTERFQAAEREGMKIPTKLLLATMIFILPAVLLIIVGPLIVSYFAHGGLF